LCSALSVGDEIEARSAGKLRHKGPVTDVLPEMDLFWIMDALTGGRKLLCISELEVTRIASPTEPRTWSLGIRQHWHESSVNR
jgi:hypothetical protein